MVVKERKYVTIVEAERIYLEAKNKEEAVVKLRNLNKRQPAPPTPEGGISLSEAERLFHINKGTISRWIRAHDIPIMLKTRREMYVDKKILIFLVEEYLKAPGQGKKTLNKRGRVR